MGILVKQCLTDINEALTMEGLGADIDLLPDPSALVKDDDEPGLWYYRLPGCLYERDIDVIFLFYVSPAFELQHLMATQGIAPHDLTKDELLTLEEAFDWLFSEGQFNVEEK